MGFRAAGLALLAWSTGAVPAGAQQGTDIYVGRLSTRSGPVAVTDLVNVTDRDGYDNQPAFGPDGVFLLYTSALADGQTDIFRYDVSTASIDRVTDTPESEYSPTVMPGGQAFSVIRVEADSAQRLWRFDLDGGNPSVVLEDVEPVGYHAWGNARLLALFVLGSPPTLQLADAVTGRADVIAEGVGRSIHKVPGELAISFVQKVSPEEWWISRLALRTQQISRLVRTLPGSEDYAWTPQGVALMGRGSVLFEWERGEAGWREVADLASEGIGNITRIAVSPAGDRIAIVSDRS